MPRQAHGRPVQVAKPARPPKRKPKQNRRLNALEVAEEENPEQVKIAKHRLGQVDEDSEDDGNRGEGAERASKRRRLSAENGADSLDEGSDLEGNRWHVGVDDDNEDSDIDSEEAFGDSDEEKFADFTFRGSSSAAATSSKRKPKRKDASFEDAPGDGDDSNVSVEEAESDEDDFGDEAVDLATAWEMDDEDEREAAQQKSKRRRRSDPELSDEDESEDETSDDDANSQLSISDADREGDHSRLQSFVAGLKTGKPAPKRKSSEMHQGLTGTPSQFGLTSSKISAADLLQYVKDPRQRQSLKILQNAEESGYESYKGGVPGKLAPPLAKRQQDRLDRVAAYGETKKELGKWIETVKQNRRAEHLSFPLQDADAVAAMNDKQFAPTSASEPMNELESTIQAIMEESGLASKNKRSADDQEQAYEELQEKSMPLEEVQARRAELRKARELMFREEIRARRIKKIKSKAFRRVHRKQREKEQAESRALLAAQGLIDSEDEQERNDRRRAEERMGARHRESKWAKGVKSTGRAAWDDDARHGVTDLARRDEELRRRMEGKTGGESDGSDSETDDFYGSEDEDDGLQRQLQAVDEEMPSTTESRLGAMAFMQKAEAARKAANDAELKSLQRSLRRGNGDLSDAGGSESDAEVGRRKFGANGKKAVVQSRSNVEKSDFEERLSGDEFDGLNHLEQASNIDDLPSSAALSKAVVTESDKKQSQQPKPVPRNSAPGALRRAEPSQLAKSLEIAPSRTTSAKTVRQPAREVGMDDYTSPSESEDDGDEKSALARAIFAGPDDLTHDFDREKQEVEEEEGDQVIDNSLPGWGSWTGSGISKKQQKRNQGRNLTIVKGVAKDKRQDVKLERVIINEKKVKKNNKYLANELPHPFESRQQYERSLRLPLGPEWTTKTDFQDATKPRVLVKQGVIRPMAKPMA